MGQVIELLRQRFLPSPSALLTSTLYSEKSFYANFIRDLEGCQTEAIIESPFMTRTRVAQFSPILRQMVKRGVRVTVYTRRPIELEPDLQGIGWICIDQLGRGGVDVKPQRGFYHRKVAILDNAILWEGSLNIMSQNDSREVMRRTQSPELAAQMVRFLGYGNLFGV